ncbi:GGDEF domain-containing protein [Thiocystis violacea]|uniref:GGDEF domain-containing protein n=1 Tax=Thiocystis violacea TaxID=13725 RepID=UPI0019033D9E|nr:GGDEF domain-containing protein [Thiocystis violacea]
MNAEHDRLTDRIHELEQRLEAQQRESSYYRGLAKATGDERLREAEGYSRLVSHLKEKIWMAETQHAALLKLHGEIERASITDDLTQVLNRRGAMERFQPFFTNCQRRATSTDPARGCFCVLLDIDALSHINDTYGYGAGDELLRRFGTLLRRSERLIEEDIIGRFAGKVFILGLPDREEAAALSALKSLLEQIGRFRFRVTLDTKVQITASAGVSAIGHQDNSVFEVIERADQALRQARDQGGDRLVYHAA